MRHAIHPTKDDLQRAKSRNVWFSFPVHAQKIFLCTLCNFVTDRLQKSCFIGLTVNVRSRCEQTAIRSHSLIISIEPPFPFFFCFLFFCFLFCLVCKISKTKPLSEKKWILSLKIIFSCRKKENDLNLDYRKLQFSELKPRMPKKSLRLKKILYILSQTKDWTFGGWEVRFFLILSSCKKGMTPFSIWKVSSEFIIFLTL